ncbi:hypothetical protein BDV3_004490 [Batrachochytrium dendrobatidis]|uniref:Amino acid transporter transmembrane domain-containing protein n=1 Tax=Batrachochytrium dendrobatidis (strain JEL423) TaxID=403673 RepID=A0A177WH19_BATDL|nr:hypothetical protein BDEG_22950 [Batrachochytrium dendrobatidis JEL423]
MHYSSGGPAQNSAQNSTSPNLRRSLRNPAHIATNFHENTLSTTPTYNDAGYGSMDVITPRQSQLNPLTAIPIHQGNGTHSQSPALGMDPRLSDGHTTAIGTTIPASGSASQPHGPLNNSQRHSHHASLSIDNHNVSIPPRSLSIVQLATSTSSWAHSLKKAAAFQFDRGQHGGSESNFSSPSHASIASGTRCRRSLTRHSIASQVTHSPCTGDEFSDFNRTTSPLDLNFTGQHDVFDELDGIPSQSGVTSAANSIDRWNSARESSRHQQLDQSEFQTSKSDTMCQDSDLLSNCTSDLQCPSQCPSQCCSEQYDGCVVDYNDGAHKSTYYQTLFNSVNILMGIGLLAFPFAFKLSGWILGVACLCILSGVTRHTAKVLALCLDWTPDTADTSDTTNTVEEPLLQQHKLPFQTLCTFGDFGEAAFGLSGRNFISFVFVLELCAASVALIILTADSIVALFPMLDLVVVKICVVAIVVPITYPLSLNMASYGSIVGIIALLNLLIIVMFNGLSTTESPGSLIVPADTNIFPESWYSVPLAFGLIMAGFCGHSVFPNLYRDMKQPEYYNKVVDHTYIIITATYLLIASFGYLMFGPSTLQEITLNMPFVKSYNKVLTQVTIWLVALNPITKYSLAISPVNTQIERSIASTIPWMCPNPSCPPLALRIVTRTMASMVVLIIAIQFPGFHSLMAILGSFFSCTVSIVFPEICFLKLYWRRITRWRICFEISVLAFGLVFGTLGTVWAMLPNTVPKSVMYHNKS